MCASVRLCVFCFVVEFVFVLFCFLVFFFVFVVVCLYFSEHQPIYSHITLVLDFLATQTNIFFLVLNSV